MSHIDEDDELEDWAASELTTPRYLSDYDDEDIDPFATDGHAGAFTTHTSFDSYFSHASKPSRTSSNVFSALVPPLTPEEYSAVLQTLRDDPRERKRVLWRDDATSKAFYRRYKSELDEGFNLMMYGYGSKREFLNAFAKHLSATGAHVIVANGFQPRFVFKDLIAAIEQVPGVLDGPSSSSQNAGMDSQVQRIHAFFSAPASPHLYIIVHNIEGAALRTPKNKAALGLLALAPHIHIVASVDHIAASQRWSLSELYARKPDPVSDDPNLDSDSEPPHHHSAVPRRGFAWLWHDLTTLAPYDFELAYADPTSLTGAAALRGTRSAPAAAAAVGAPAGAGSIVTETAARHVLASVTQKAKKLFVLLGSKQLEVMDGPAPPPSAQHPGPGEGAGAENAYDYDRLFAAARDNFVATSDTALRALLGEFRDHGLVVAATAQGAEAMWIPMRREALGKIVGELMAEGN